MSKGINKERQLKRELEADGWWVGRAAGSLGDADLVALKAGETPRLIEVKSTARGPFHGFGPADRRELLEAAKRAGADAWLAWFAPRKPAAWLSPEDWPSTP